MTKLTLDIELNSTFSGIADAGPLLYQLQIQKHQGNLQLVRNMRMPRRSWRIGSLSVVLCVVSLCGSFGAICVKASSTRIPQEFLVVEEGVRSLTSENRSCSELLCFTL